MNDAADSFSQRCYDIIKLIPKGKVTTYKEVAIALNSTAWRAVGSAMAKNKHIVVVPCHRVVRSDGNIGQYALGENIKSALLMSEGIEIENGKVKNLSQYMHTFSQKEIGSSK